MVGRLKVVCGVLQCDLDSLAAAVLRCAIAKSHTLVSKQNQPNGEPAFFAASQPASLRGLLKRATDTVGGTLGSLLFLTTLALIFDLVGYLPPFARLFLVYGLLALPLCRWPRARVLRGGSVLLGVMISNALVPLPHAAEVSLLTFAHLWIWSLGGLTTGPLVQGILFYTVLHLYLFASPLGYQVLEALNAVATRATRWFAGGTLHLGYTYQNLGSLLLFLCLSLHAWDRSRVSKFRTAAFLFVAVLLNGFLAAVLVHMVDLGPDLVWELKFRELFTAAELARHLRRLMVLIFPALIFLAHAIAYLFLHHDTPRPEDGDQGERTPAYGGRASTRSLIFAAASVVLLLLVLPPTTIRKPTPHSLVFLERGVVSFTKPDYTRFGRGAGGMYGCFPEYARLFGCRAKVVKEIPEVLEPDQILVSTNLDEPLTPVEMERIWAFVRAGGKLWVLGDHTFIKNGRNHINDLLKPCHIRFNHDSAQFFPQGWFNSYRIRQGTPFSRLKGETENRLSILVGASLELGAPARPLIMGRFGYGDLGVMEPDEKRGFIGDFEYQITERLGDLVLVAGEQVGKGKVLVFGDTTSFFNNNMSRSFEILRACLSWLGEPRSTAWFNSRTAGGLAGAGIIGVLVLSLLARRAAVSLFLVLLAAVSFLVHQRPGLLPYDRVVGRDRLAIIDYSHNPYASKHGSMADGLYGVSINLLRHGMLPVTQNRWDRELRDSASLLFLNAPRRTFSAARRQELMQFMERGGTVIMACGFYHYANARALLEPLGLRVRNLPLGRFFDRTAFNKQVLYFSAWPVEVTNPNASVISFYDEWPLIVHVPVSSGHLVLVGDSEFFHNRNLESVEQYSAQNIEFVRNLLDYVRGERTAP